MNHKSNRHRIAFPRKAFLKESRQEYSGSLSRRIILELIQNALDAKSTRININYNPESHTLICEDNGVGMNKETLLKGQLTFAGTVKEGNSVGGYGASKKIVLFSSRGYQIHTRDLKAVGINVNFRLYENQKARQGTKIKIRLFAPEVQKDFRDQLKFIVDRSFFACEIYFNGELFKTKFRMPESATETGAIFPCEFENRIIVRLGGLFSFDTHTNSSKGYIYEVVGKSKDAFTQNREGFQQNTKFLQDFAAFESKLNNNTLSGIDAEVKFRKSRQTITDFHGIEIAGNIPENFKPGKKHKMIFSYCKAVCEMVGIKLFKHKFGFYFDSSFKGLCAGERIYINPDYFNGENWETEIIETLLHECIHSSLPLQSTRLSELNITGNKQHNEAFINEFGSLFSLFLKSYSGINPIKSRMREIEKSEF